MATSLSTRERFRVAMNALRGNLPEPIRSIQRKQIDNPIMWPTFREGVPQWSTIDISAYILEGYTLNSLVYSAVSYKQRSASLAPLRAFTGDEEAPDPAPRNSPLNQLLRRPNKHQSQREWMQQAIGYLNITGNLFIVMVRDSLDGLPEQLINLSPDRIKIVPKDGEVIGYIYVPEGEAVENGTPILSEDVMHIKLPNLADPLEGQGWGMSPLLPAARTVDVHNDVTRFLKLFYQDGPKFSALLKFKDALSTDETDRIKERWREQYGGVDNWSNVGVLGRDGEYQAVGMNFDEMGFDSVDERSESLILGPFGVPGELIGGRSTLKRSSLSDTSLEAVRTRFWQDTLLPELRLIEDELSARLTDGSEFPMYDTSQVPALQIDIAKLTLAAKELWAMGVPFNIAKEQVGLSIPDIDGGDVSYIPMGVTVAGSESEVEPEPAAEEEPQEAPANADEDMMLAHGRYALTKASARTLHNRADRIAESWERRFRAAARKAFKADRAKTLAIVSDGKRKALAQKASIDWMLIENEWKDYYLRAGQQQWRNTFVPVLEGVITEQATMLSTQFGFAFDVQNLFTLDWFTQYKATFAQPINDATLDTLSAILQQGQLEGWSIDQIQKNIGLSFEQWMTGDLTPDEFAWFNQRMPQYRLERIARTETIRASNVGGLNLYIANNVPGKTWLATGDARTRQTHLQAWSDYSEGGRFGIIPIDEEFKVGGCEMLTPGSSGCPGEDINCRCTILPADIGEDETTNRPPDEFLPEDDPRQRGR